MAMARKSVPTRRLFVAVWPDEELAERLRLLARPQLEGLRWTTRPQWHVTLRFLGSVDAAGEEKARDALAAVAASMPAPVALAGPAPRALGTGVWVLPVEGLEPLARAVIRATRRIGSPPERRRFSGHLTLARSRTRRLPPGLPAPELGGSWRVDELTLVCSQLNQGGARYEVVGTWPLTGQRGGSPGRARRGR
jgi:2'-5' RNA ligase